MADTPNAPRQLPDPAATTRLMAGIQGLARTIAHKRTDADRKARAEAERLAPTPDPETVARQLRRDAALAELARVERETEAAQTARRWAARAKALTGFPPRRVADIDLIPDGHTDTIETLVHRCERWPEYVAAVNAGGLIMVYGPPGVGKTTEACALARWYMGEQRGLAVYSTADDYVGAFRNKTQGYGARMSQGAWISGKTQADGLLVLDELDKMPAWGSDTFTAQQTALWLAAILQARHDAGIRPTVLLSNWTPDEAHAKLQAPLLDRLKVSEGGLERTIVRESYRTNTPRQEHP